MKEDLALGQELAARRLPFANLLAGWRPAAIAAGLVLIVLLPFVAKNFFVFQLTLALIYAIAILGLNLLTGFLFGLPALRLEGIYLALATFALAVAIPQLLKSTPLEPWTGGVQGVVIVKPDAPFGLPINSDQWLYFFTVAVAIVLYVCAINLVRSRTGRAIIAIRENPIAASAMGVNVSLYKSLTFGVSALYTGIAGALGAIAVQFVAPDSFTFFLSIALFVGLIVGGVGS